MIAPWCDKVSMTWLMVCLKSSVTCALSLGSLPATVEHVSLTCVYQVVQYLVIFASGVIGIHHMVFSWCRHDVVTSSVDGIDNGLVSLVVTASPDAV